MAESPARWTVRCWAVALRVVTEAALKAEDIPEVFPADHPENPRIERHLRVYDDAVEKVFCDIAVVEGGTSGKHRRVPVPMIWADEQGAVAYVLKVRNIGGVVTHVRLPVIAIHSPEHFPDPSRAPAPGTSAWVIKYTLFVWSIFTEEMNEIVQSIHGKFPSSRKIKLLVAGVPPGSELVVSGVANNLDLLSQTPVKIIKYRFDLVLHASLRGMPGASSTASPSTQSRGASSDKLVDLVDVLVDPDSFDGQFVQMTGIFASLYTDDSSFKLEQGDHEIWVFYSQLPKEQKSMSLRESEADERAVIVEGVLQCGAGTPELIASRVVIQGMKPRSPSRTADGSVQLSEILLDPTSFDCQQVRLRGTYAGLYTDDSSFKVEQGDHNIWVFYSKLPKEQKSMILRRSEADGRAVIVEGVLHFEDGTPELIASNVAIEGLGPRKPWANNA